MEEICALPLQDRQTQFREESAKDSGMDDTHMNGSGNGNVVLDEVVAPVPVPELDANRKVTVGVCVMEKKVSGLELTSG